MVRLILRTALVVSLALCATPLVAQGQSMFALASAEPRARTGETIILGKDNVIRVEDMTKSQYRLSLARHARAFRRETDETVHFASGSSSLDAAARSTLMVQAAWLIAHPTARFTVTGYADATGDHSVNQALGLDRARAVAAYLVRAGVGRERLVSVSSLGELTRIARHAPDAAEQRRVVTRIVELADPGQWSDDGTNVAQGSGGAPGTSGSGAGSSGGTGGTSGGSTGGTSGGSTGGTSGGTSGNNGKAHGRNGTQPGQNR